MLLSLELQILVDLGLLPTEPDHGAVFLPGPLELWVVAVGVPQLRIHPAVSSPVSREFADVARVLFVHLVDAVDDETGGAL